MPPDNAPALRARKALGQHFLVDRRVLDRILDAAVLEPGDVVIEVGPGRGVLTRQLASLAAKVVAVELDLALVKALEQNLAGCSNVSIVHADAREIEPEALAGGQPYKVVANLPYYAASPIVRRFLEAKHKPKLMVVMVQKEVAQNMAATPGRMGLLSVAVQLYGDAKIVTYVPPGAFRPAPKVHSAIVRIQVYPRPALALESMDGFFHLVKAGFSAPRKQIINPLSHGLSIPKDEVETLLSQVGIDPRRRAETLSLEEWGGLYRAFCIKLRPC